MLMMIICWAEAYILQRNTHTLFYLVLCLEVKADKTKYMVMSRDQNAGQSHNIKFDNSSFERVEEFQYLGTT